MILLIFPLVNAFGVTTFYWDEKPLVMYPGETKDVYVELQNVDGTKDITLKASMGDNSIATIIDPNNEYFVPLGSKDIKVNINMKIPEDAPLGSKYDISVSFKEVTETDKGKMLQIAGAIGTSIPVVVKSPDEVSIETPSFTNSKNTPITYLWVLIIIIIVIIGFIILFKKKK